MKYDAIIIGSGQGGNPLAYGLADLGWSVALIEKKHLGGTCINVGCTPTKTMVHRAQVAHYARHAARWGVNTMSVSVDLAKIVAQKDAVVLSFRGGQQRRVDQRANLRLYHGHARFVAPHQLSVGDGLLESEKIFIDTGGRPAIPLIPGLYGVPYLTNESIMELTSVPRHLLILGGGYIGLEFGQMFSRYGSRVTVLHTGKQIVSREDPEIAVQADGGVARPRPTRSSTAGQIGNIAEPDCWMICAEPRATLAVELLAQRPGRVIPFVAPAPLQLGHDQIDKIGESLRHHRVG